MPEDESRALLEALNLNAIVLEADASGNVTSVNDKFLETSKYSRDELLGQNQKVFLFSQQPQPEFDELWQNISSGNTWRGEVQNKTKDGIYYWLDTLITPVSGTDGTPHKYITVGFIITDKKQAQESLSKKILEAETLAHDLEKFKIALDGTSDHVVITDPNGIALYANQSIERVTGYSPEETIGQKVGTRELWGGNMSQEFYHSLWQLVKVDKKPFVGEITNKKKNGETYQALVSISPILTDSGELEFLVGIERDITREKQIDKSKSELISLASHQLRTPLTSIRWNAELLTTKELDVESMEFVSDMYNSTLRMIELVNALLNVSRIDLDTFSTDLQPNDIKQMVDEVLIDLKALILEHNAKISISIDSNLKTYISDKKIFKILLTNLLTNAVKYSKLNSEVLLKVGNANKGTVVGGKTVKVDSLFIVVTDSGIGIPEEQRDKIFTKMFRADNAQSKISDGSGLGLYLVKEIVAKNAGEVWFLSEKDKGSEFYIVLPADGMIANNAGTASFT